MKRNYPEDQLQISVSQYLKMQYPQLLWWHTPNGGTRNKREGAKFKAMGVKPGVADLLFFWRGGKGAIEPKAGKNILQDTQKLFQQQWIHTGGQYAICRSIDEVIVCLKEWGVA